MPSFFQGIAATYPLGCQSTGPASVVVHAVRLRAVFGKFVLAGAILAWDAQASGILFAAEYDPLVKRYDLREPLELTAAPKLPARGTASSSGGAVKVYCPATGSHLPIVLFSHGLGGSREGSKFLGEHLAKRGYVAIFLQHAGSDTSVWKDKPRSERRAALVAAASPQNFLKRIEDVSAVLSACETWQVEKQHPLEGRLDLGRVGMSGHSFGAVTTQAVSGQKAPRGGSMTDPRIRAAAIYSPSPGRNGVNPEVSFGDVKIPWLLMTGTNDDSPIGEIDAASRQTVYPALPPGDKYQLVLAGAEHSVFTENRLPGEKGERNPKHHPAILAITTAFWDAYLNDDDKAKAWLAGKDVRSVLDADDQWERK